MKKKIVLALLLFLLLTACGEDAAETEQLRRENETLREQIAALQEAPEGNDNNPIDAFYEHAETDPATVSLNEVAGSRAAAWEKEARHMAQMLKDALPLEEDRILVDAYIAAAEEQLDRMDIMAIYPVSDTAVPQTERIETSGTMRGVMWAGGSAMIWEDTYWQLRFVLPRWEDIPWVFDESAARQELEPILIEN